MTLHRRHEAGAVALCEIEQPAEVHLQECGQGDDDADEGGVDATQDEAGEAAAAAASGPPGTRRARRAAKFERLRMTSTEDA